MGANPTGLPREPRRDLYYFIHNVYANFFKDTLDYFGLHLLPDSKFNMISTYDKGVQYMNQMCENEGREMDKANLPAIMLNPSGEFNVADALSAGKFLWRFPNLAPGFIKRIFDPVYKDANTQVHVGFMRMQGEMELLFLINSFYEYCDVKMLLLNIFGGYERWIYPQFFTTFIILPKELINYRYTNEYTGLSYTLDWESSGAYQHLVKTINQDEMVIPCNIKPVYRLMSLNDASTKYGGTDDLAEWKLGATISYEIEIPTYLVLESDYLFEKIDINITAGSTYSTYNSYDVPVAKIQKTFNKDWNIDETSNSTLELDGECTNEIRDYNFHTRYFHTINQAEMDSTSNVIITIPEQVDDLNGLLVNSKFGPMDYGDHYRLLDNGNTLEIRKDTVDLEVGMVIELYIYLPST